MSCPVLGDDNYLASPKGGLVDDHLLIVPIEHAKSIRDLSSESVIELHKYQNAVFQYYSVGNHALQDFMSVNLNFLFLFNHL
jgi:hypothetical protein